MKIFLITILVLAWTLNPFFKKYVSKDLSTNEYIFLNHTIITVIFIFYFIYLISTSKVDVVSIPKKMSEKQLGCGLLGALNTIIASIVLIRLVSNYDVSDLIPKLQPIVIVLSVLIGVVVFKDNISIHKWASIALIVAGLLYNSYCN